MPTDTDGIYRIPESVPATGLANPNKTTYVVETDPVRHTRAEAANVSNAVLARLSDISPPLLRDWYGDGTSKRDAQRKRLYGFPEHYALGPEDFSRNPHMPWWNSNGVWNEPRPNTYNTLGMTFWAEDATDAELHITLCATLSITKDLIPEIPEEPVLSAFIDTLNPTTIYVVRIDTPGPRQAIYTR